MLEALAEGRGAHNQMRISTPHGRDCARHKDGRPRMIHPRSPRSSWCAPHPPDRPDLPNTTGKQVNAPNGRQSQPFSKSCEAAADPKSHAPLCATHGQHVLRPQRISRLARLGGWHKGDCAALSQDGADLAARLKPARVDHDARRACRAQIEPAPAKLQGCAEQ